MKNRQKCPRPGKKKSKNRQIYRRRCAPAKKYLQLFNTIQNKLEDSGLTIFKNKNVKKKKHSKIKIDKNVEQTPKKYCQNNKY